MFVLDAGGRFERATAGFADPFGYDAAALAGEPADALFYGSGDLSSVARAVRAADGFDARTATGRIRTASGTFRRASVEFVSDPDRADERVVGSLATVDPAEGATPARGDGAGRSLPVAVAASPSAGVDGSGPTATDRFAALFELIDDAVVEFEVVGMEPVVRAVNPGFEAAFGYGAAEVVGASLNEYVVPDGHTDEAVEFDQRTAAGKVNSEVVTRETSEGPREFIYRGIPYDRPDGQYGLAIYTDITDQNRRKRHHAVLHRVLRHNLRNALTVILGSATEVERRAEGKIADQGQLILSAARDLETLSERARLVERAFDEEVEQRPVDVVSILRSLVTTWRTTAEAATIVTDFPERLPVLASGSLEAALSNLVSNAVVHGGDAPTVRLVARREGDRAIVKVVDDGPGIPAQERAAVFDERPLSQLSHGTGLGLWLVKWVVDACRGDLDYARTDGETVVSVALPAADGE